MEREKALALLQTLAAACKRILDKKYVGLYAHGSLALGGFRWAISDIDFLLIVDSKLSLTEKRELAKTMLCAIPEAPVKGLEMSAVLREYAENPIFPTPYEFHFSSMYKGEYETNIDETLARLHGDDADLPAHFAVARKAGVPFDGPPPEQIFAPVPKSLLWKSLQPDFEKATQQINTQPIYTILNLCRFLAYKKEGILLSKEAGGLWGIQNLPTENARLICTALRQYQGEKTENVNEGDAQRFTKAIMQLFK